MDVSLAGRDALCSPEGPGLEGPGLEGPGPEGLCKGRFHADYLTDAIDYSALRAGDVVTVDGTRILITRVGKPCHPGCALAESGRECRLRSRCAFGQLWQE